MRKQLLWTVAAIAITTALSGPLKAADLPFKGPVAVAPAYSPTWSGFYIGGHVGYGSSRFNLDPVNTDTSPGRFRAGGLAMGLHTGYNWQAGQFVYGIEGDATITPGWQKFHCQEGGGVCNSANGPNGSQTDWLASIRGRLGFAFDRTLIYATGGVAFAKVRHTACSTNTCAYQNSIKTGGVVGGGIEWKYNPQLSLRLEALHYMFNERKTWNVDSADAVTGGIKSSTVVRVGATWHFDEWGKRSVAARY